MSASPRLDRWRATPAGREAVRCNNREWQKANRAVINKNRDKRYREQRLIAETIKLERGCAICGYNADARALDFDHLGNKTFQVSKYYGQVSDVRLLAEIGKCQVLCANCHRIKSLPERIY